jgi:hypothetical protein
VSEPLTIVTWLWKGPCRWGEEYTFKDVNRLALKLKVHLKRPHTLVCYTNQPTGLYSWIEHYPVWDCPVAELGTGLPEQGGCWRRLMMFERPSFHGLSPMRYVSMDLDVAIIGDLDPLFERDEPLVMWGSGSAPGTPYNGSMWLHTEGTHTELWDEFDARRSPPLLAEMGYTGSDQAWISHKLPDLPKWTMKDGVYHYGMFCQERLPKNARIVFAPGSCKIPIERMERGAW